MFNFFSFKQKRKKEDHINSQIVTRLDRIIELLEQKQREELLEQKQRENSLKTIQFDQVHIDHLENIIFRLDHIDIEELSGKLVIGNNITGTDDLKESLILKMDKENAKKETLSEESFPSDEQMEKTPKGFRFRKDI